MLPRMMVVEGKDAKYIAMPNDYISKQVFNSGTYDPFSSYIASLFCDLHAQPCVLDVGANIGTFTVPVAQKLLGKGSVLSFEPQQIVFYQLCGNIVLNRLDNVTAHNLALSDSEAVLFLPEVDYNNGWNNGGISFDGQYNKFHNNAVNEDKQIPVKAITLNSLDIDHTVALVKIDVEGFERKVIMGGGEFLKSHNYPPLLFEAWPYDWFVDERKALLDLVTKDLGYELTEYDLSLGNFVAQHPEHSFCFDFKLEGGRLSWTRLR